MTGTRRGRSAKADKKKVVVRSRGKVTSSSKETGRRGSKTDAPSTLSSSRAHKTNRTVSQKTHTRRGTDAPQKADKRRTASIVEVPSRKAAKPSRESKKRSDANSKKDNRRDSRVENDRNRKRRRPDADRSDEEDEQGAEVAPRRGRKQRRMATEELDVDEDEPTSNPTPSPPPVPLLSLAIPPLDKLDAFDLLFFSQAEYHVHLAASQALHHVLQSRVPFFELLQTEQRRRTDAAAGHNSSVRSSAHGSVLFPFADPPEPSNTEDNEYPVSDAPIPTSHDDVYRTLRDALLATCALGHRSCMALWGPRGCGKHRILRFVCEVLTGTTTTSTPTTATATEQPVVPQANRHTTVPNQRRSEKPSSRATIQEGNQEQTIEAGGGSGFHAFAKTIVFQLDGRTLRGDSDALRSIAEQLLFFLMSAIDTTKLGNCKANNTAEKTKWRQRGGSVAAAAMLMEKDWSFHTGNFGFGLLFGFPQAMAKRREGENTSNQLKATSRGVNECISQSDSSSDEDGSGSDEGAPKGMTRESDDDDHEGSETDSEVEGGGGIFLTRTSAGPGGGVASALPALQEALLTMRSHGVSLVFCVRDAERFGVWCDQLMYVLSGLLHESSSSARDVGGVSLVLTSSAPDMQHLEKRLSSRLTCEMCFVPMIRVTVEGLLFMCYRYVSATIQQSMAQSIRDTNRSVPSLRSDVRRCWLRVQHAIVNGLLVYVFSDRKQCRSVWQQSQSHSHRSPSCSAALRIMHEKTLALQTSGATLEAFASTAAGLLNQITSGALPLLENRDRERLAAVCALRVRDVMGPSHQPSYSEAWEPRGMRDPSMEEGIPGRTGSRPTGTTGKGCDAENAMNDIMHPGGAFTSTPCKWITSTNDIPGSTSCISQDALKRVILRRMPERYVSFGPAYFMRRSQERGPAHPPAITEIQCADRLLKGAGILDGPHSTGSENSLSFNWFIGCQPPDLLDLMSTHGLIRLGYGSRELFLLHTYCVVHAGAGVAQRRVVDLLEDVASSLGTRAAASLDREAFRYALRQLVRLKIVSLTSSRSTALASVATTGKNGRRTVPFSMPPSNASIGIAEEDTGLVSLIGSVARHKVYLLEVLESTPLSEQLLGLDSRERQSLRSML